MSQDALDGTSDQELLSCKVKLTNDKMARFATMDLTGLCAASNTFAIRKQMTEDMRDEVDKLYYDFRCKVVKLAIQNCVGSHLYFKRLGQNRKVQNRISWNNFQKYDPEAQKLYNELTDAPPSTVPHPEAVAQDIVNDKRIAPLNGKVQVSNASQKATLTMVTDWIHQKEADSTIFHKGGSPLGTAFLSMLADSGTNDSAAEFHTWVAARAIELDKGKAAAPHNPRFKYYGDARDQFRVGNLAVNVSAIRLKLREMIRKSHQL
ncbi:hypothetical protein PCANC_02027 [Puccinia coronata f. sp. avenae]|uniref:Uncharacterized protein n=1 Tax=Puccinia coronata f. sp. avenae TaxID=200324 RepID=A0A2N5W1Y0_9BASI|nr:hypothetical protein PCANC_02027 [Puccinia coronata f. sp. avenae]